MGFKILFVLATLSVYLVNGAATRDDEDKAPISKGDGQPVDWYDCRGKAEGNYQHPHDCKQYISCTRAELAYEMDCAICHVNALNCPEGRLHFNEAQNKCLWVHEAGCSAGPTIPPSTPGPTTPPPNPETCGERWNAMEPLIGTPCDAEDADECKLDGCCHRYWWCERDWDTHKGKGKKGTWHAGTCSEEHNLYFEPDKNEHGGLCNLWSQLQKPWQDKYNNDPTCIDPHCEWEVDPDNKWCASTYIYFHPDRYGGEPKNETCPDGLMWSQSGKNCLHCSEVHDQNDQPCCPSP